LVLARLALFPALLVPELAVIHQPAHWWGSVRRNLDEVEPSLPCHVKRFPGGNNADLPAFVINQSYLAYPNALVNASLRGSGNGSPPEPLDFRAGHTKNVGA